MIERRWFAPMNTFYESDRAVSEYLLFHHGEPTVVMPWPAGPVDALNFPVRCVTELLDAARLPPAARALEVGCAVGRATFELARHCPEVIGIDQSAKFIAAAETLKQTGRLEYGILIEGDLREMAVARVADEAIRQRVHFEQGDAMRLRVELGEFDVVLLANLLCRLPDPRACLARIPALVKPGGQLLITTPGTWLEEYTPRENWLGGCERDGRPVRTVDSLRAILEPDFELRRRVDLPFVIREHERKFQWSVAEGTAWIRRQA